MVRFPFVRSHGRLRADANAYVDGELSAAAHRRFETHLATCAACRDAVVGFRAVKQIVAAAPAVQAPRSFRLTPAMAARARPEPVHSRQLTLRFAQGVAALAVVALITVVTIDLTSSGNEGVRTKATGGALESRAASAPAANQSAADSAAPAATSAPTGVIPPRQSGVTGASNDSGQPSPTAVPNQFSTEPTTGAQGEAAGSAKSAVPEGAPPPPPGAARPAEGSSGDGRWHRPAEVGIAIIGALAVSTAVVLGRRRKDRA